MLLDEESQKLVVINTHRGLFKYNRLPFGVASAPALFQKAMDTILQGIPHVICYIDDILVSGSSYTEHLQSLEEVFRRLANEGITVKRSKCDFLTNKVEFLGHVVDPNGLHTSDNKLKAILQAPPPQNIQQLRSFLGLVNYYGKFVRNLSSTIHPLNQLLSPGTKWHWSSSCSKAFSQVKHKLQSSRLLVHYDSKLPLTLATDASPYGVGAVISHVYPDGMECPIAFASRTLSKSERNYPQMEKEALSIIFGIKKFHQYLYGRHFSLITDHKPLVSILSPTKGIPPLSAARMQRWALILSAYTYDISFRSTKLHANADALSRLPLDVPLANEDSCGVSFDSIFNFGQLEALPVTAKAVALATSTDPLLSQVLPYVNSGWPTQSPSHDLKPFFYRRHELTIEGNCLMWGMRVVIPAKFQQKILKELHLDHPGICRMKSLARSHVWWPKLDTEVEAMVKSCLPCLSVQPAPPKAPLNPWIWPSKPWSRIHVDFAGPLFGKSYFIIVDAHSKWPEVFEMQSTTSTKTIEVLTHVFSAQGLTDQLVSDNGPQFTSDEFTSFLQRNGIKHIRTAPYHPATNGQAERFVKTLKKALLAGRGEGRSSQNVLASFLLTYRSTPHAVTNQPPSMLLNKRSLKTVMNLVRPNIEKHVQEQQSRQKKNYEQHVRDRNFEIRDGVVVKIYKDNHSSWVPGIIVDKLSQVTFVVELEDSSRRRCHIDQLRACAVSSTIGTNDSHTVDVQERHTESSLDLEDRDQFEIIPTPFSSVNEDVNTNEFATHTSPRYPSRVRRPPDRFF